MEAQHNDTQLVYDQANQDNQIASFVEKLRERIPALNVNINVQNGIEEFEIPAHIVIKSGTDGEIIACFPVHHNYQFFLDDPFFNDTNANMKNMENQDWDNVVNFIADKFEEHNNHNNLNNQQNLNDVNNQQHNNIGGFGQ